VDQALAPPVEVFETPGGHIYRLPPRALGAARAFAVFPLLIAVTGCAGLIQLYLSQAARGPFNDWMWGLLILLGLVWARGFYMLVSVAAAILAGRTEIEVRHDGAVRAFDRTGWFRVRWGRLPPGAVQRFVLKPFVTPKDTNGRPLPVRLWHLTAESVRGWKVWLAPGHSRAVLTELAKLLATQCSVAAPEPEPDPGAEPPPAVPPVAVPVVVEEPEVPGRDVPDQPPTSRVVAERHPDGVTMTVPPLGLRKANGGLILMGLLFTAIGGFILVGSLVQLFLPNAKVALGAVIPGAVFFIVGSVFFITSLNTGLKKVVVAVVGDRLLTFETGLFGSRRREFTRAGLLDIACRPSNVSVNNKPLPQIQIVTLDKSKTGLLTGRDEPELMWIATVLRHALGLPSEPPEYRPRNPWMGTSEIRDPSAGS
jgi:hypothetical protein